MITYPEIVFENVTFGAEDIRDCTIVEDFNPLAITVPINTMDLTLYSDAGGFTIINPSGVYEPLLTRQPMAVYINIDGQRHFVGQYFMDAWENQSENLISFTCIDALGLLDKDYYKGGLWLTPIKAGVILDDIFAQAGLDVMIDDQVYDVELTGWLPIMKYRAAVQQVCFAAGGYVRSSRQSVVKIGKMGFISQRQAGVRTGVAGVGQSRVYQMRWRGNVMISFEGTGIATTGIKSGVASVGQSQTYQRRWRAAQWEGTEYYREVMNSEQGADRVLTLREKVTGVEIVMHDITPGDGERKLFEGTLASGVYPVEFSQPMHTLTVEGATIVESSANHAVLEVSAPGEVRLTGMVYNDLISTIAINAPISSHDKPSVIRVDDATLVNSSNGAEIAQRVFDYYQQRYKKKMRLFGSALSAGNIVQVETLYGNTLFGVIEHAEIDLAGGSLVDAEVIGVVV